MTEKPNLYITQHNHNMRHEMMFWHHEIMLGHHEIPKFHDGGYRFHDTVKVDFSDEIITHILRKVVA